jgi:membrane associated rhomboid family serine protease
MDERRALRVLGILFCVLAVSNFLKPLEMGSQHGFVFLGRRLAGTANLVVAPLFGLYLALYGIGILRMRRFALPMGWAYAAYVVVNLVLFNLRMPEEAWARPLFGLVYATVAIGASSGAAWLLYRRRAALT